MPPAPVQVAWLAEAGVAQANASTKARAIGSKVRKRLVKYLKENGRLVSGGLNMEPFEVLRDMIRASEFPSIGGAPQLVKVYEHMNAVPAGVLWPDRQTGTVSVLGRPLMDYEKIRWRTIDPDNVS